MNISTGAQSSLLRYERYAFSETAGGVLTGHYYGKIHGEPNGTTSLAAVEPFLNRKGEFDKTPGFEGAALLTAGAWLSRERGVRPGYGIRFEDRWTGAAGQFAAWEPTSVIPESGVVEIVRATSVTGEALNCWLETPAERAAAYLQWFSQVSVDLQASLRRWLPYLLLREESILNNPALRDSLLFYAATRPYLARVRGLFTWDVICPDSMASVFRSGSQNLPGVMEQAQRYALAGGRPDLAEKLAPSEMRLVLIHVRRDPRALKGLLAMEGKLVESILALGGKGREIADSKTAPRNLHRFCGEWSRSVQTKLRRVLGAVTMPQLVNLALVEATASLARCAGVTPEKREWTEFRPAQAWEQDAAQQQAEDDSLPLAA